MRWGVLLVFVLVRLVSAEAVDTLRGFGAVGVEVESLDSDAASDGLSREQIRTDAELQLRKAGVRVENGPGGPFLYIRISTNKSRSSGLYAYAIDIQFRQPVIRYLDLLSPLMAPLQGVKAGQPLPQVNRSQIMALMRSPAYAMTWQTGMVGTVGAARLPEIREDVKDAIDRFLNDWLTANPKQ